MLTCLAQDLRVTAWITTSHASIFIRQQGPRKDQPAPRPAKYRSLHPIVVSHLRMSRSSSYQNFQLPQAAILKSVWTSAWID